MDVWYPFSSVSLNSLSLYVPFHNQGYKARLVGFIILKLLTLVHMYWNIFKVKAVIFVSEVINYVKIIDSPVNSAFRNISFVHSIIMGDI